MTEEDARAWLKSELNVSRETMARLERYVDLLLDEATRQNLIADSTRDLVWSRHIADSAQLVALAIDAKPGLWMDLGSGAGLPGLVVAALTDRQVVLVESRRKRAEFLLAAVEHIGLPARVQVQGSRVETLPDHIAASVISARAFAPLERLIPSAHRFSRSGTLWLLPKGRSAQSELESVRGAWQGVFHVKQSVTDPESAIIVARNVRREKR